MKMNAPDKTFPSIRLAGASDAETNSQACRRRLKETAERIDEPHVFSKGQFVRWKPGLKNRKYPDYGEPVIVTALLPIPVFDPSETSAASPYFQEPLTLVIGTYRDDDLLEFRVDGRRFEPFVD
jgi:hypothetical protein